MLLSLIQLVLILRPLWCIRLAQARAPGYITSAFNETDPCMRYRIALTAQGSPFEEGTT